MNKRLKVAWIIATILSLFTIVVGTYYVLRTKEQAEKSFAAADVSLYFDTTSLNSNINTILTLKLKINPATNQVTATEIYLTFDPVKISIESITNSASFPTVLKAASIDNSLGTASIILGSSPTNPVITASDVIDLRLKTKTVYGDTTVNVAQTSKVAAVGFDTSVLGTYGQMVIHIINPATATPSSTATPTGLPSPTPTSSLSAFPNWDVDQNGLINIVDIGLVSDQYGVENPTNIRVDVDRNGIVNIIDIGTIIDHYQ